MGAEEQAEIISSLNSLLRFLLSYSPLRAETMWGVHRAYSNLPRNRWIKIPSSAKTGLQGWILREDNGLTRHSKSPPPGIKRGDILRPKKTPSRYSSLGAIYQALLRKLTLPSYRNDFNRKLSLLVAIHDGSFEREEVAGFIHGALNALGRLNDGPDILKSFLINSANQLRQRFSTYDNPAFFEGWMRLLFLTWSGQGRDCFCESTSSSGLR